MLFGCIIMIVKFIKLRYAQKNVHLMQNTIILKVFSILIHVNSIRPLLILLVAISLRATQCAFFLSYISLNCGVWSQHVRHPVKLNVILFQQRYDLQKRGESHRFKVKILRSIDIDAKFTYKSQAPTEICNMNKLIKCM